MAELSLAQPLAHVVAYYNRSPPASQRLLADATLERKSNVNTKDSAEQEAGTPMLVEYQPK